MMYDNYWTDVKRTVDYSDRLSAADSQGITCYEPVTCQMHHLTIGTSDSLKVPVYYTNIG